MATYSMPRAEFAFRFQLYHHCASRSAGPISQGVQLHFGLIRRQGEDATLAVEPEDPHHGGGVLVADAVDAQRAAQSGFAAAEHVCLRFACIRPDRRQLSGRRLGTACGPLPEELARRSFAHVHLCHAQLVCRGGARDQQPDRSSAACEGALHCASPSILILYFLASARTAKVRCSDMTASVQSCRTMPRSCSKSAGTGAVIASSRTARQPFASRNALHSPGGDCSSALAN